MKMRLIVALAAMLMGACASNPTSGGGEVSAIYPTQMSSPQEINKAEFGSDKFAETWVSAKGGGMDDFKKVTIPAYTLEFVTFAQDVDQNKLSAAFVKADGAKNIMDMTVTLPFAENKELMQEITNESHKRLTAKLQKAGFQVVDWSEVKAKSADAVEFEKEKMDMQPVVNGSHAASFAAAGAGRLNSIFWAAGTSGVARDTDTAVVIPHFTIGFGYFGGEPTPTTIKESHGPATLAFTPQVQIFSGSGLRVSGKYETGFVALKNTAVVNETFGKFTKDGDSRDLANSRTEDMKAIGAGVHGTTADNIVVSSRAGLHYNIKLDQAKFKETVMAQLSMVEDMIVARYKAEQ